MKAAEKMKKVQAHLTGRNPDLSPVQLQGPMQSIIQQAENSAGMFNSIIASRGMTPKLGLCFLYDSKISLIRLELRADGNNVLEKIKS